MMLLVADLHLDDNPLNDYRWEIFAWIAWAKPDTVYILGDLCHKKDRHPGALVNRIVGYLRSLVNLGINVTILMGNHDEPLKGVPFFTFLNDIPGIRFIIEPTEDGALLLLPHSNDPNTDWTDIDFSKYVCIMMHQPITGADIGNGRIIERDVARALLPDNMPIYSGDIHVPQYINGVEYIGTPYPINYGEEHRYRMLMLDDAFVVLHEIPLNPTRKHSIKITSIEELAQLPIMTGDMAKVEFTLPAAKMDAWPVERAAITEWAEQAGVKITSVKAVIETTPSAEAKEAFTVGGFMDPVDALINYSEAEGIDEPLMVTGYIILEQLLNEGHGDASA